MQDNIRDIGGHSVGSKSRSRPVLLRHSVSKRRSVTKAGCRGQKRRPHTHYLLVSASGIAISLCRNSSENLLSQLPHCMRLLYEANSLGKEESLTPLQKVIAGMSQAHYLTLCCNHAQG